MSNVHQSFTADLNAKPYEQSLVHMENKTRSSMDRTVRELSRVDSQVQRSASLQKSAMNRIGGASLQVQDIAVQLQAGASATTIIAQQGSQIASAFGAGGAILGGVIAIGAALYQWKVIGPIKKQMEDLNTALEKGKREFQTVVALNNQLQNDLIAVRVAEATGRMSDSEVKNLEKRLILEKKIADIQADKDLQPQDKEIAIEAARIRFQAEQAAQNRVERRAREEGIVQGFGEDINQRADEIMAGPRARAEQRRAERARARAERRAINERLDAKDRELRNARAQFTNPDALRNNEMDREKQRADALAAVKAVKNKTLAEFSDEQLQKIINGIGGLIAK